MNHGVGTIAIFGDDADRRYFIKLLKEHLQAHAGKAHAWCLMTNHFHLLVEMPLSALAEFMRDLTSEYAARFNQKNQRKGHLFMQRFKSEPVENEAYFITVIRYIHQNPVKAFMCPTCDYPWSSYREYLGKSHFQIVKTEPALAAYGGLECFIEHHSQVAFRDKCMEMMLEIDDATALDYARRIIGEQEMSELDQMNRASRKRNLRTLKNCMLPGKQIARITGINYDTVMRA